MRRRSGAGDDAAARRGGRRHRGGGRFEQVSPGGFDWLMSINFGGVVWMTRAFVPVVHPGGVRTAIAANARRTG